MGAPAPSQGAHLCGGLTRGGDRRGGLPLANFLGPSGTFWRALGAATAEWKKPSHFQISHRERFDMSLVWNEFENYAPRDGVFSGVFYVVGRIRLVSGVAVTALQLRETRNGPLLVPPHPMGRGWAAVRAR